MAGFETDVLRIVRGNPINSKLIDRLAALGLNQCFLVAGCLFQTYWNHLSGFEPTHGIADYDVFYFDESDLSWQAEDEVIGLIRTSITDLAISVDVKNQARVHLWYEERFGHSRQPLRSCEDGIDRYLVSCTCMGIDVRDERLYAPDGMADLRAGHLRYNEASGSPRSLFLAKAGSYRKRWPWLQIMD